jgi:chemotaxis methyl-accepting protein methylase
LRACQGAEGKNVINNSSWPGKELPGREGGEREFVFTLADFERVRKLIYEHAGIALSSAKQDMVYSRLARRLRETRLRTFGEYLALLERGDKAEWEKFVNSLTTNLTSCFREPHHFPILAEHLKKLQGRPSIKIWCCASSTGEEPYSIAMTVVEAFNSFNVPVSIVASDLDTSVLATAAKGVYTRDRVERLSPDRLNRFFLKGGPGQEGTYAVRPELRRLVTFRPAGRAFLPECHDLLRQSDAIQDSHAFCSADGCGRSSFCRPLGEFSARGGCVPFPGQDRLRIGRPGAVIWTGSLLCRDPRSSRWSGLVG